MDEVTKLFEESQLESLTSPRRARGKGGGLTIESLYQVLDLSCPLELGWGYDCLILEFSSHAGRLVNCFIMQKKKNRESGRATRNGLLSRHSVCFGLLS